MVCSAGRNAWLEERGFSEMVKGRLVDGNLEIRPYLPQDEADVLGLLAETLGGGPAGGRSAAYFRWKHFENPFGSSILLVAVRRRQIIGLRAFLRWRFRGSTRIVTAVRAVDTATHPEFQGSGVFSQLTSHALQLLKGKVDVVFNTPNDKSLQGYLKLGWRIVGKVPISVRVKRPFRFVGGLIRKDGGTDRDPIVVNEKTAAEVLQGDDVRELLERAAASERGLSTPRDLTYMRWRYADAPGLDYRAIEERGRHGLRGLAVFRVRRRQRLWETTLSEVITRPDDLQAAKRLLRRVRSAAKVDHVTAHFTAGSATARVGPWEGFIRVPGGMLLAANPLREVVPDPMELHSWNLSLGDLEVF